MTSLENKGLVLPRYLDDAEAHPRLDFDGYRSTALRHPKQPLTPLPQATTEITGPLLGEGRLGELDSASHRRNEQQSPSNDLTKQHEHEPQGQRIIVYGRVLDSDGRPVPQTLLEIWQANAAGRYRHVVDNWPAPLDPNFTGLGRTLTDSEGRYTFTTIKPGAYPWKNHYNAWRPAHIHFSLFGRAFTQRLVTQMYFPGDPLFRYDPIFNSVPDEKGRERMVSRFVLENTRPDWALAYEFDIVLRGPAATPFENETDEDAE